MQLMQLLSCKRYGSLLAAGLMPVLLISPVFAQDQIAPLKIRIGEKASNFSLHSASGKSVRLANYTGRKVLLDFYRGYW